MTKSFKDNYTELLTKPTTTTNEETLDSVVITPNVNPPTIVNIVEIDEVEVGPIHEEVIAPEPTVRVELTEEIAQVLTEQREQSAKVLESVMKTNTKIANGVTKLVKNTTETNEKLVEAIVALTEKIGVLEAKLDAIENLEIPTPVVHVQMPNKAVNKEIHRDDKGIITHITESEVVDDEDE